MEEKGKVQVSEIAVAPHEELDEKLHQQQDVNKSANVSGTHKEVDPLSIWLDQMTDCS